MDCDPKTAATKKLPNSTKVSTFQLSITESFDLSNLLKKFIPTTTKTTAGTTCSISSIRWHRIFKKNRFTIFSSVNVDRILSDHHRLDHQNHNHRSRSLIIRNSASNTYFTSNYVLMIAIMMMVVVPSSFVSSFLSVSHLPTSSLSTSLSSTSSSAAAASSLFSRPTPFAPDYRPECALIIYGSSSSSSSSSYSSSPKPTTSSSIETSKNKVSSFYFPTSHVTLNNHHHQQHHSDLTSTGLEEPIEHNQLLMEYNDLANYFQTSKPSSLTMKKNKKDRFESWYQHYRAASVPNEVVVSPFQQYFKVINKRSSYVPGDHICITYENVDQALNEAKILLGFYSPPYEINELNSDLPKPIHVSVIGELLLQTSAILARMHGLSKKSVLFGLPRIDTQKTSIQEVCPTFLKMVKCEMSKYRTLSGMCNNLEYPSWGSARSAMLRFMPPDYADGLNEPRAGKNGKPLPAPRVVSFLLHRDVNDYDHEITYLVVAWGQMLAHDLMFAAMPKDKMDKPVKCCKYPQQQRHSSCLTIDMPAEDPFYKYFSRKCMDFVRALAGVKANCALGPRQPINAVSTFIDANFVYGHTKSATKRLREFFGGRLKTTKMYQQGVGLKDLLPMKTQNPDNGCERSGRNHGSYCFDAGDDRTNIQLQLVVMHTIMMREHNRLAEILANVNPHWDDEKLFQEARRIVGAINQHITYNEFLPIVIGRKMMTKFGLNLLKHGYYNGYDSKVNPGVRTEFHSAFRFGHSLIPDTVDRYNKFHDKIDSYRLSSMIRQPFMLYRTGMVDTFIFGLINQPAYRVDTQMTIEITNHLFQKPGEHFGQDLASINILRGRETGIPGYNDMREYCGLPRVKYFEDLYGLVSNHSIHRLADLYEHVDDIDFWSGGVAEFPLMGAMIGPTMACVIAEQFTALRRGDRFWYENQGWPSEFTPKQLEELRKVKLARLLCDNSDDMETIQLYPLLTAHQTSNPRVECSELPELDLSHWREDNSYFGHSSENEYETQSKAA